jgi:hypothetical protein
MLRDDTKSGTVEGAVQWHCCILAPRGISWVTGQTPRYSLAAVDETEAFVEEINRRRSGKNKPTGRRVFIGTQIGFRAYRSFWDPQMIEMCKWTMTAFIFLSITTLQIINSGFAVRTSVGSLAVLTGILVTFHRSSRQMLEN